MRVLKFGGTSIGSENQIKKIVKFINRNNHKIIVLSAFSGVTNLLSEFILRSSKGNGIISKQILNLIHERHTNIVSNLFSSKNLKKIALNKVNCSIKFISKYLDKKINVSVEKEILAQGELLSAMLIYLYMLEQKIDVAFLPALKFMKINKHREPDYNYIKSKLTREIEKHKECIFFITNGFICKNNNNKTDNLGRGASDYTATIIGNVLNATEIVIWTDIDGLHNNDPRYVKKTKAICNLSYNEASELAYFGAKILHPASITPAQNLNIPIIIKNTMEPDAPGTTISDYTTNNGLKAIAAKDGITTIKVKSGRMMHAYGFLRKIFEVFEKYHTSVDMLTTSEISVAMTIDNNSFFNEITEELAFLGEVEIEKNQSIICIVGDFETNRNISILNIIEALDLIPIQMISFGASKINISFVVNTKDKIEALNLLNNHIFRNQPCLVTN